MLSFVNILEETAFQDKENISNEMFGLQIALSTNPIDFQYTAYEAVTSFDAIRKDITGAIVETISLSTSLITYDLINSSHICNGQTAYSTDFECGIYYFVVNDKWQSESFNVMVDLVEGDVEEKSIIAVSGLEFYDSYYDIPEYEKLGSPIIKFAAEFGTNLQPLPFQYLSDQAVSTFDLVKIDSHGTVLSTSALSASLVSYNSITKTHNCNGLTYYADIITCGVYYFAVNNRYKSKPFEIFELLCPIISNIAITNAIEESTAVLNFDVLLTGAVMAVSVDLTYVFSCAIDSYTETMVLLPTSQNVTSNFNIPSGVFGYCSLTILNNVCSKSYTYNFTITELTVDCLELIGGGNLELIGGGCLELIS